MRAAVLIPNSMAPEWVLCWPWFESRGQGAEQVDWSSFPSRRPFRLPRNALERRKRMFRMIKDRGTCRLIRRSDMTSPCSGIEDLPECAYGTPARQWRMGLGTHAISRFWLPAGDR